MIHMIIGQMPGWLQVWKEIELAVKPRLVLLQTRRSVRQRPITPPLTAGSGANYGGGSDRVRRGRRSGGREGVSGGRRVGGEGGGRRRERTRLSLILFLRCFLSVPCPLFSVFCTPRCLAKTVVSVAVCCLKEVQGVS